MRDCIKLLGPQQRAVLLADIEAGAEAGYAVKVATLAGLLASTSPAISMARSRGRKQLLGGLRQRGYPDAKAVPGLPPEMLAALAAELRRTFDGFDTGREGGAAAT